MDKRRIRRNRWGLTEDVRGAQIVTDDGKLYNVTGVTLREFPYPAMMLTVRHFNGESGPDVPVSAAWLLLREWDV